MMIQLHASSLRGRVTTAPVEFKELPAEESAHLIVSVGKFHRQFLEDPILFYSCQ